MGNQDGSNALNIVALRAAVGRPVTTGIMVRVRRMEPDAGPVLPVHVANRAATRASTAWPSP